MKFMATHPWRVLAAIALGFFFNWALGKYLQSKNISEGRGRPIHRVWIIWALLGLFYCGFYLVRPVYYAGYHGGSLGDNYGCLQGGVNIPNYVLTQHYYFPWVPAKIFHAAVGLNFFSLDDPFILEKAYPFFSLPHRVLVLFGFFLIAGILRLARCSPMEAALGAGMLAVSFGYWFWALQSNAMGLLLMMILLSLYLTILALQRDKPWLYSLAGLATSLCIYVHIASAYACVAIAFVIAAAAVHRRVIQKRRHAWVGPLVFGATSAVLGGIYYSLVSAHFRTTNLSVLLASISDYGSLGTFSLDRQFVKRFFQDGLSTNITLFLGLHQFGGKSRFEYALITLQLSLMVVWGVSFLKLPWKTMLQKVEDYIPFWVVLTVLVFIVTGFATRLTWMQYYVAATPVFVVFVALVAFSRKETGVVWAIPLVLITLYVNGFSSAKVFAGEHVQDHPLYRRLQALEEQWPDKPIVYVDGMVDYYHNFNNILSYYRSRGHFSNISWVEPVSPERLFSLLKSQTSEIVLNAAVYPSLATGNTWKGHRLDRRRLLCPEPVDVIVFSAGVSRSPS